MNMQIHQIHSKFSPSLIQFSSIQISLFKQHQITTNVSERHFTT